MTIIEFMTCFHEFSKYESTNFLTNLSQLKKKTNFLLVKIFFLSFEHLRKSKQISHYVKMFGRKNLYLDSYWENSWKHVKCLTHAWNHNVAKYFARLNHQFCESWQMKFWSLVYNFGAKQCAILLFHKLFRCLKLTISQIKAIWQLKCPSQNMANMQEIKEILVIYSLILFSPINTK